MPRLWSPTLQGLPVGRGAAVQGSRAAVRFRALALGGGAPGFSLWLRGGPERAPNSAPGRGAGARRALGCPGQRADLSSSRGTRPAQHHRSPGSVRTGTRRPAAHDDIKSPPQFGPHIPAGLGAGGGGGGGGGAASGSSRPGQLGDVVPSPIKAAA